MIYPKKLQKGDTVAIVAPAGFIANKKVLDTAVALLKSWNLQVVFGAHVFKKHHHFAGTDTQRARDFQTALDNTNIKAIWCCKGGYGSVRIIDALDFTTFKKYPKWILGYSDITVFLNHIHNLGIATVHSCMPTSIAALKNNKVVASLQAVLFKKKLQYNITAANFNKKGIAKGQLVGGNLALLTSLLGSSADINTKDKILFIEDIGEYKYKIDRMLYSLKRAGYFKHCKGLLVGAFTKVPENDPSFGKTVAEIILEITAEFDFPICFNFPAGHITDNRALIIGDTITLEVANSGSKITFSHGTA